MPQTGVTDTIDTLGTNSGGIVRNTAGASVVTPAPSMGNSRLRSSTAANQDVTPGRASDGGSADGTSDGTAGLSNSGVNSTNAGGLSTDAGGAGTGISSTDSRTGTGTSGVGSGATGDRPSTNNATSAPAVTDPTGINGGLASGGGRRTAGVGVTGDSSRAAYGATMEDCMSVWDAETHMTKQQWRTACQRTTTRGR